MTKAREIRLASFLSPSDLHIASWRQPGIRYNNGADFDMYLSAARVAEAAKFDLVLLGDVPARSTHPSDILSRLSKYDVLEPQSVIAALAVTTKHIGLAATASTTYHQPYHIARQFASIDHLSKGRAAWNVVTTANPTEAYNFGLKEHPAPADRYARAEEFVDVVFGLWNSWDENAFVRDRSEARYFRPDDLRALNHRGPHFDVRGPLDVARSPQDRPIIVQAGSSDAGQNLAARVADIVFTSQQSLPRAQAFYRGIKDRAAGLGRSPHDILIVSGVAPFVGRTRAEAQAKFDALQALIEPELALFKLAEMLGDIDLSAFEWDKPLPDELPPSKQTGIRSRRDGILDFAKRHDFTLGQLAVWLAGTRGHPPVIGTGADVADWMEEWFMQGGTDGFLLLPYSLPESISDVATLVVPELQRRGLFKMDYAGKNLRENLGLSKPPAGGAIQPAKATTQQCG